jgi:hypothetical protein
MRYTQKAMANEQKNPHAAAMGRLGGPARAKALSPARRRQIAIQAARARWGNRKKASA